MRPPNTPRCSLPAGTAPPHQQEVVTQAARLLTWPIVLAGWDTCTVDRAYYSQRIGRGPLADPKIQDIARILTLTVSEMWKLDYMQEWHGFTCVDAGDIGGRAAMPLVDHIEAETGWREAWPLPEPLVVLDVEDQYLSVPVSAWDQLLQGHGIVA